MVAEQPKEVGGLRSGGRGGRGASGSGVQQSNWLVQKAVARRLGRVRECARGHRWCKRRRAAGRGSGSRVRAAGGLVRVRAAWRALVGRIESLAASHGPPA